MFATGTDRCPINAYKEYRKHRPADMLKSESRFYLRSLDKIRGDVWYTHQPVDKDKIGRYMKTMAAQGELEGRLVNHSARRTFATTLRESGISPNEIAQLGVWKNVQSVNHYSVPSLKAQEKASKTLSTLSDSSGTDNKENSPGYL